jgi:hypothetical protein
MFPRSESGNISRGGTLTVSGRAWADKDGDIGQFASTHFVAQIVVNGKKLEDRYDTQPKEFLDQTFNLSVQLPQDTNDAQIQVIVEQNQGQWGAWRAALYVDLRCDREGIIKPNLKCVTY